MNLTSGFQLVLTLTAYPLLRCVRSGLWSVKSAGCLVLGGDGVGKGLGGVAMDDAMVLMLSGLCVAMVTMGC